MKFAFRWHRSLVGRSLSLPRTRGQASQSINSTVGEYSLRGVDTNGFRCRDSSGRALLAALKSWHTVTRGVYSIDPPAGSPTGTLLRLLPGSNRRDQASSPLARNKSRERFPGFLETVQSRVATGGVYKSQGRIKSEMMTHTY